MLLHIADDEKFIDVAIEQFEEVAPNKSVYLINIPDNNYKLKYIRKLDKAIAKPFNSLAYKNILKSKYDAVVFHNLSSYKLAILSQLPSDVYVHWMVWGADIYSISPLYKEIILPITRAYLHRYLFNGLLKTNLKIYYPSFWNFINIVINNELSFNNKLKKIAGRINSVSTIVDTEYSIIKKYLGPDIEYYPFRYGSIEHFFPDIENSDIVCSEESILIANSASPTCNHFDTFEMLRGLNTTKDIYVPLSYGNTRYASIVKSEGYKAFGDKFKPLTEFLPLNEYKEIMQKCGIVLMNHLRQRAMGNVIISLWYGAKLYMQPTNPAYIYLINNDIKVYNINEFDINNIEMNHKELAQFNREKLKLLYNKERILNMTNDLVRILSK